MCEKIVELLETGYGVIIDHVITSDRIYNQLAESLSSFSLRTVRITCPLDIIKSRELERGDRCIGSAEASAKYLFPKDGYDLVVDTGATSPEENARLIFDKLF
jgi:chloramphenicol 3-O phosphotransferase